MDVLSHVLGIPKIGGGGVAAPAITTLSIPDAGVGIAYSQQIEATGTVQTWTLLVQDYDDTDITDDCGLEIDENGLLAGTPVIPTGASGLWTVTVTAQNAGGSDEASFEIEVWVLRVDFSDDKAAPVGTYAGEFGSVSVDDSGNNVLVESGVLKWTNVVGANDPRVQSSEITRRNGRVFITHVALHNQRTTHVIRNAASSIIISLEPFGANFNIQSVFIPVPIGFNGAEFITALVVHDGWIDAWVKHSGTWRRLFVVQTTTPTDIIYAYATINTNGGRQVAAMRVIDAPAPLDVILSDALVNVTPAVTDTEYNAAADLVLDLALTSPSDLTDAEAGIRFRKSSDNYWELKIDSSGNLVLERFASGVGQGACPGP